MGSVFTDIVIGVTVAVIAAMVTPRTEDWKWKKRLIVSAGLGLIALVIAYTLRPKQSETSTASTSNSTITNPPVNKAAVPFENPRQLESNNHGVSHPTPKYKEGVKSETNESSPLPLKTRDKPTIEVTAPNGIAIGGGVVTNPTVNNYQAPPSRTIPPVDIDNVLSFLKAHPATVGIEAVLNDSEAYRFGTKLYILFQQAEWQMQGDGVRPILLPGAPWYGIRLDYKGDAVAENAQVYVDGNTPQGHIIDMLMKEHIVPISVHLDPNLVEGAVTVVVSSMPQQ